MTPKAKTRVLAVVGPTATGKTKLSVNLAKQLDGEIISADSMQVYEGMEIASAKPTKEEMGGIVHHMMSFVPLNSSYNVSMYVKDAKHTLIQSIKNNKLPIVVGGTGLYVDSLLDNISFADEGDNSQIREGLEKREKEQGIEALYDELCEIDLESAKNIHIHNKKRVIRALEIYYLTGKTMTEQKRLSKMISSPYDVIYIGLKCRDRNKLYDRINARVDLMMRNGLLEEAKKTLSEPLGETAKMAIGHKELKPYIEGKISLEEALETLKRETRRYAKRQLTWFLRNERINWIDIDTLSDDDILQQSIEIFKKGGSGVDMENP